jgi:hypothetical protein
VCLVEGLLPLGVIVVLPQGLDQTVFEQALASAAGQPLALDSDSRAFALAVAQRVACAIQSSGIGALSSLAHEIRMHDLVLDRSDLVIEFDKAFLTAGSRGR